jgi:hypothetical protein
MIFSQLILKRTPSKLFDQVTFVILALSYIIINVAIPLVAIL